MTAQRKSHGYILADLSNGLLGRQHNLLLADVAVPSPDVGFAQRELHVERQVRCAARHQHVNTDPRPVAWVNPVRVSRCVARPQLCADVDRAPGKQYRQDCQYPRAAGDEFAGLPLVDPDCESRSLQSRGRHVKFCREVIPNRQIDMTPVWLIFDGMRGRRDVRKLSVFSARLYPLRNSVAHSSNNHRYHRNDVGCDRRVVFRNLHRAVSVGCVEHSQRSGRPVAAKAASGVACKNQRGIA